MQNWTLKRYILDQEEQKMHPLILPAAIKGELVKTDTVQNHVAIEDINDSDPVFSKSVYEVTVVENILKGSQVLMWNATDYDEGTNSKAHDPDSGENGRIILILFILGQNDNAPEILYLSPVAPLGERAGPLLL
ncbi:hypothetical protein JD844_017111 [Phrynosoma platyrhinos]|uniref:Cadherin domain-containing protein n=1 Tax=Phrynosoma platyrhinos TaxID=52577 RepID=A0ABQ7SLF3_PHRPL|nr:hypothetical protein JD844_017111 [Phrynosoma platyrhinos]